MKKLYRIFNLLLVCLSAVLLGVFFATDFAVACGTILWSGYLVLGIKWYTENASD